VTGGVIQCHVVKCKLSKSQGRKEVFYIRWGEGIDDMRSVLELGISYGVIKKGGSWLSWEAPDGTSVKVQGTNNFQEHLKANPEHFQSIYAEVIPHLGNASFTEDEMEEIDADVIFGDEAEAELDQEAGDLSEPDGE